MQRLVPVTLLGALFAVLLTGCASDSPEKQAPAAVEDRTVSQAAPGSAPPPSAASVTRPLTTEPQGLAALKDPNSPLAKRSVFFDYDSFEVKPEFKGLIEAHARFLVANPTMKVFLQGHTDERGTPEYNLALGQKRAEAVRKMLALLGVKEEQMESVSFGETKPRADCPQESCWSQNRRTDFAYQGE